MNLKVNQIIKNKDGDERKVLEVFTNTVALSVENDFQSASALYIEKELLDRGYIIPEEVWEPEIGDKYYYISILGVISYSLWYDDLTDNKIKNTFGIYKDQESAEKALAEIKIKLGK